MPSAEAPPTPRVRPGSAICVDFGSTFTKAVLVDLTSGDVLASSSHPTSIDTDLLDAYAACRADLEAVDESAVTAVVRACSSAGGGLRIAVVGNELLVTAEAGRRVALSSGGKVVAVLAAADGLDLADPTSLAEPDVVLLTGGTDGGNEEVLLAAATALAASPWRGPVVLAGNTAARDRALALLGDLPVVVADNVLPRIGVLRPEPARAAIREVFLSHVIGGKHLSRDPAFAAMVRAATPDVVLSGVELVARGLDAAHPGVGDVVVVDVGGATTDVHSHVEPDPEDAGLARDVVATSALTRTVEGDLGMRWSAPTTATEGGLDGLPGLAEEIRRRHDEPGFLPTDDAGRDVDEQLARAAVGVALRRHAGRSRVVVGPDGRVVERTGTDLRSVEVVITSGGVFRHGRPGVVDRVLAGSTGEIEGGWQLPRSPRVLLDAHAVLAAVGLLAHEQPTAAYALSRHLIGGA